MKLITILLLLITSTHLLAQDAEDDAGKIAPYSFAWSITTGPLLPNQIDYVTEIQPSWGLRISIPKKKGGIFELGGLHSHEKGVTMYNVYTSLRGEVPIETLIAHIFIGLDYNHFITDEDQTTSGAGGHIGGGFIVPIAGDLYFRTDMKFNVQPGTSLYVGFGFETRFSGGGETEEEK